MSDNISTLIGILLDVSGSMRESVGGGVQEEGGEWVRSIFQVIDDLIKYDVSCGNLVFSVGVGASCGDGIFDLISTLEQFQNKGSSDHHRDHMTYDEMIERILNILERSGASTVKKWATKDVIRSTVSCEMAALILSELESDPSFVKSFVNFCLPRACRDFSDPTRGADPGARELTQGFNWMYNKYASVVSTFRTATEEELIEVVEKAKGMLLKSVSVESSIFSVQKASNIIHGCVDEEQLTETRINELKKTVTPFIYGRTPLFRSLKQTIELFSNGNYRNYKKLLFILSDGKPTDVGDTKHLLSKFREADITVVSCFISKSRQVEPLLLHSVAGREWEEGAKFLFHLSSTIPTQLLPRTIFIKRGWKIDITNNETKLFLHVNHPDHIRDACDLAQNVVCCQDALSDLLVSVSLDIYINQSTTGFPAQRQTGGTCYANATAAVLHMSMKRILGREGGYPDFNQLRQQLIDRYGEHGANTLHVLQTVCPHYRLQCREVDVVGAMRAVTAKRPVVARFRLTDAEWDVFGKFYEKNPTAILTKSEINISRRWPGVQTSGHAVVLTSYNSECLRLMNSWGADWGDMGFFKVQTASVLGLEFFDVFWTEGDLTWSEKAYYAKHGSEVAAKLVNSLKSLQVAKYQCPLCRQTSLVTEFTGQLLRAKCPKCHREFRSDEAGNILALNMYLTSLSR
ncbi:hypothetical protein HOLleu_15977 [Holothuria leucospilota]|uniref:Uncharacterized protein n=1 Tax=Holothuria leucospilota TaxID=206669 RepID=A0A9Q1C529_HOLLE|nr:hypothetical protein HOLleu_15977 [Holothuria leucospilota]